MGSWPRGPPRSCLGQTSTSRSPSPGQDLAQSLCVRRREGGGKGVQDYRKVRPNHSPSLQSRAEEASSRMSLATHSQKGAAEPPRGQRAGGWDEEGSQLSLRLPLLQRRRESFRSVKKPAQALRGMMRPSPVRASGISESPAGSILDSHTHLVPCLMTAQPDTADSLGPHLASGMCVVIPI